MIYKLYIGSNNKTKKLEKQKAIKIALDYYPAFSTYEIIGCWQGEQEKTLLMEIETTEAKKIKSLAKRLCIELKQQAVGIIKTQEKMLFVS